MQRQWEGNDTKRLPHGGTRWYFSDLLSASGHELFSRLLEAAHLGLHQATPAVTSPFHFSIVHPRQGRKWTEPHAPEPRGTDFLLPRRICWWSDEPCLSRRFQMWPVTAPQQLANQTSFRHGAWSSRRLLDYLYTTVLHRHA